MGQTLSEPLTKKLSDSCENERFKVGSSSMQGWRISMEDAHSQILNLPTDNQAAYFAVYDGHGGSAVAQHAASNLHKIIAERAEYKNGDISTALSNAFLEIDEAMQNDTRFKNDIAGCTAVACVVKEDKLYCANVGDSRAVACINGKCVPLSFDHKPNNPLEEARIKDAGGFVEFNRVNGNLALSRALGDFSFKRNTSLRPEQQMVTALPDIEVKTITDEWEYIILACDGVWDVLTSEEACELVRVPLSNGIEPHKVCERLIDTCLAPDCNMGGLGCDNMTAILVCFLHGKSWSDFCSKLAANTNVNVTRGLKELALESDSDEESAVIPGAPKNVLQSRQLVTRPVTKAKTTKEAVSQENGADKNSIDKEILASAVGDGGVVVRTEVPSEFLSELSTKKDLPPSQTASSRSMGALKAEIVTPPSPTEPPSKGPLLPPLNKDRGRGKILRKAKH